MYLTDEIIPALTCPPGRKDVYIPDTDGPSKLLKLRVGLTSKTWFLRYSSPVIASTTGGNAGKQIRLRIGMYPAMSLASARRKALETELALSAGQDPSLDRVQRQVGAGSLVTLGDLIDKYLATVAPTLRASTLKEKRRILENEIRPALGKVRLSGLTARMLMQIVEAKEAGGRRRSAKAAWAQMAAMFTLALSRGWIERNPLAGIRLEIKTPARERVLSQEEIGRFWVSLQGDGVRMTDDVRDILRLCLLTGSRVGEVCGMTAEELELDGEIPVWRIPAARMKANRPHLVVPSATAVEIMRGAMERSRARWRERDGLVFRGKLGDGVRVSSVSQAMADGRKALGLAGRATPHDLRRTYSTRLYEAPEGFSSDMIEQSLAHAVGPSIARVYNRAKPSVERLKPLVEYIEAFVLRCAGEERRRRAAENQP